MEIENPVFLTPNYDSGKIHKKHTVFKLLALKVIKVRNSPEMVPCPKR